jgi:hypothetical protein
MRYVWVDAGNDPNWDKGVQHRITGWFMPIFDARTTRETLNNIRSRGLVAGVYVGHAWFPDLTPQQLVDKISAEYKRLAVPGLRVMFNLEQHDPEYIVQVLERWRVKHPNVGTSWSPEGMQGGWMDPTFVKRVVDCRVRVVPQCFIGNMERRESDIVLRDLLDRGFPASSVSMFYDGSQLGYGWDGYAFTMGRLP